MLISDDQCQQQVMPTHNNDSELTATSLAMDELRELNNGMLFARPLNEDSVMSFTASVADDECQCLTFSDIHQPIILSTLDHMVLHFSGGWALEVLTISQVTTLFSFLDFQAQERHQSTETVASKDNYGALLQAERSLALLVEHEKKTFMTTVISTLLNPQGRWLECLFSFIRNVESYWIAHFLLSQVMDEDKESDSHKICNASKIYGVSESYFRKLCHHAFTHGPKKQLRLWRAAHSVLQLIEKDNSIATIAGDNGYSSSSHFSSEIKSLFGITPREFKKLEGLFHE